MTAGRAFGSSAVTGEPSFDLWRDPLPKGRCAALDRLPDTVAHLIQCRAMRAPADPVRGKVQVGWLEPVERLGKTGVGRMGGFEFIPEGAHVAPLIVRQKPEDTIRRR